MINDGVKEFYEVGPGNTLQGLIRKINRNIAVDKIWFINLSSVDILILRQRVDVTNKKDINFFIIIFNYSKWNDGLFKKTNNTISDIVVVFLIIQYAL